jgi:Ca-activated chloride channel family protein
MVVQQRRRSPLPFVVAIVVAIGLIAGLRTLVGGNGAGKGQVQPAACGRNGITLTMAASSEKAQLVKQMAADYQRRGPQVGGRCVQVNVTTKASGAAMAALARGWNQATDGPRPDVWSPASSGWVTLLQQRSRGSDRPGLVPPDIPRIAASPLVIAMPRPMAEALGWPRKRLGWREMLDLARSPDGWASRGHPEWGRFRLGKTNPNFSTSGLNATIGAYFAGTGLSSDLREKDVTSKRARDFVAGVERSVVHYGDTTLTFLANLQRADDQGAGLSYISAVTVEEKSVWDYNQGNPSGDPATLGQHGKPRYPLVAIYPKEGTLLSDHPYVVLKAPWVDDAKRQAAAGFLGYLQGRDAQGRFQRAAFRDFRNTPGPLATEANGLLAKEPATLLQPPAPPVLDKLLASWAAVRKRANVLLVMDTSGSMGEEVPGTGDTKLDLAKRAAINSLREFDDADRVGLWMFSTKLEGDSDHRELVPVGPMNEKLADAGGQTRRAVLRSRIEGLPPEGGTGLYDTSLAAFQEVSAHLDPDSINAVVLLTDGRNEDDGISLDNLIPRLRTEQGDRSVRLFTIAYGADADLGVLRQIAEATNGAGYDSSNPGSIDAVFTAVVSNF